MRVGLWSKLNHVNDVTQEPDFHDLVGFTDTDLDNLRPWLDVAATGKTRGSDLPPISREGWRDWYNGYRFAENADAPVYNPYAIVHSLQKGRLDEYWSQSGHLGAVETLLQEPWETGNWHTRFLWYTARPSPGRTHELHMDMLKHLVPADTAEAMLAQWDREQLTILLHQTGYLTLKPDGTLVPPNQEVALHMANIFLKPWGALQPRQVPVLMHAMHDALVRRLDIPALPQAYNQLLQLYPHQRFTNVDERPYNLLFDTAMMALQSPLRHQMEKSGLQGDADTLLTWDDVALCVEFKHNRDSARLGLTQMGRKHYLSSLNQPFALYIGLSLNVYQRQVTDWLCDGFTGTGEPLGKEIRAGMPWPAHIRELWACPNG